MFKNRKYNLLIIGLLTVVFVSVIALGLENRQKTRSNNLHALKVEINGKSENIEVEYAKTPLEIEIGLMNRNSLGKDNGMLFIFEDEAPRAFWMKNTLIPLDIIFFDANKKFINVARNAQPCPDKGNDCPTYESKGPAKYVLETNSGRFNDEILQEGAEFLVESEF